MLAVGRRPVVGARGRLGWGLAAGLPAVLLASRLCLGLLFGVGPADRTRALDVRDPSRLGRRAGQSGACVARVARVGSDGGAAMRMNGTTKITKARR